MSISTLKKNISKFVPTTKHWSTISGMILLHPLKSQEAAVLLYMNTSTTKEAIET
jgi:hypothetical protein